MSDLVERQAAIKAVNNAFDRETLLTGFVRSIAVRAIRDMPPAQPEQKWIPCSEQLPEEGIKVLACLKDWRTGERKTVVSYRIDYNYWHGYGRYNEACVAWMPLPEPYKEGEADVQ